MLNKKGFVLVETLIVTVIVLGLFTYLYVNTVPLIGEYLARDNYDDIDSKYVAHWIRKMVQEESVNAFDLTNGYQLLTCENFDESNLDFCNSFRIEEMYIVSDINSFNDSLTENNKLFNYAKYLINKNINTKFVIVATNVSGHLTFGYIEMSRFYGDNSNASIPELVDGMIPVRYDATSDTTGNWIKVDSANQAVNKDKLWYNYDEQRWANAVTVTTANASLINAPIGTVIPESTINTYWVWIPRYSYTIKSEDGTNYYGKTLSALGGSTASQATPGAIDIKFVDKLDDIEDGSAKYTGDTATNYYTHPAFCFGTLTKDNAGNTVAQGEKRTSCDGEEVNGFWMAKFETTATQATGEVTACSNTSCTTKPTVKPNYPALNSQKIGSMFYIARSMQVTNYATYNLPSAVVNSNYDIHMLKSMEWGAVAYLSQSIYGKYGNSEYTGVNKEIYQNKSYKSSTITTLEALGITYTGNYSVAGNSNGTPSQTGYSANQYAYNNLSSLGTSRGQAGAGASTTGNIYGVYDMSGGLGEFIMGNLRANGVTTKTLNQGSYGPTAGTTGTKYFDSYLYGTTYNNATAYARGLKGDATKEMSPVSGVIWYNDTMNMPYSSRIYFVRGNLSNTSTGAGLFSGNYDNGASGNDTGFRLALKP